MVLTNGKDDGFANLAADGIAESMLQKYFAEKLVGGIRKEAFLEFALFEGFFLVLPLIVFEFNNKSLF